jgi:hypothetical protein
MSENQIKPEKITKPIQLLAAWLAGLFSINSCFLIAAAKMDSNSWESSALVLASIINVPIFLGAVFLLQTKFRPELQEDSYYSNYLSKKTNEPIKINKSDAHFAELSLKLEHLEAKISQDKASDISTLGNPIESLLIGVNKHLTDRETIKQTLADNGVLRISNFGPDSMPMTGRVMSISQYLENTEKDIAIKLATKLKLDGYNVFDPHAEDAREDILIGSYGKAEFELIAKSA